MAISILNNIASLTAQNQLAVTQSNLNKTLFQLSSGSRINSGADDAAGLAIADGLHANITALTQSAQNANSGVGSLQVADGSLAQVTQLLNRAVTLATDLSLTDAANVTILNGLTLQDAAKITLNSTGNTTSLDFSGTQTLGLVRLGAALEFRATPELAVFFSPAVTTAKKKDFFYKDITRVEFLAGVAYRAF